MVADLSAGLGYSCTWCDETEKVSSLQLYYSSSGLKGTPRKIFQIFCFIENRKTLYMHVRASPGESFSRKQDENGPLVQKLGPGPAHQHRLKI